MKRVAPFTGAWIETDLIMQLVNSDELCRALHGRVD